MENALALFGLASALAAGALAVRVLADWWLRARQLEQAERTGVADAPLAAMEARLARIEHVVEATAVEVERIAEAQRFTARLLAEQRPAEALPPPRRQPVPEQG